MDTKRRNFHSTVSHNLIKPLTPFGNIEGNRKILRPWKPLIWSTTIGKLGKENNFIINCPNSKEYFIVCKKNQDRMKAAGKM